MARTELNAKLNEIRSCRDKVISLLQDVEDSASPLSTKEWSSYPTVGVMFLRFGDHMREHANQIAGARNALQAFLTDTQRKLAESERAWGHLLGTMVGLTDEDSGPSARRRLLDRKGDSGPHTACGNPLHGTHSGCVAGTRQGLIDRNAKLQPRILEEPDGRRVPTWFSTLGPSNFLFLRKKPLSAR